MGHAILGTRFAQVYGREPAWHRIQGATIRQGGTVTEAVQSVAPDLYIEKSPMMLWSYSAKAWIPAKEHYALYRPPLHDDEEGRVFGVVGQDYELLQVAQFASILDPLSAHKQVETVGILHQGKEVFVTFNNGGARVNGDDVYFFDLFRNVSDGKTSVEYYQTDVLAVCANTVAAAISLAKQGIYIRHNQGASTELGYVVSLLELAEKAKQERLEAYEYLGRTKLYEQEISEILNQVYPDPPKPSRVNFIDGIRQEQGLTTIPAELLVKYQAQVEAWDSTRARLKDIRLAVGQRLDVINDRNPSYAETRWALWNAVTEVENYRSGKLADYSVVFGARGDTMTRAFNVLVGAN